MEINEILSFRDLAKLLNITSNKLTRLTRQGLPFVCLGDGRKIFMKDSVTEWLRSKETWQRDQASCSISANQSE